jgi:hypothetical protein
MVAAEVLAEVEVVRDAVASWCVVDRDDWSAADRSAVLCALIEISERVDAAVLHATAEWDRSQVWAVDGALTPVQWLRGKAELPESDARRTVRSARLVARNDDLGKALAVGDITTGHVDALARAATPARHEQFDEHADTLLDAARSLSVDDTAAMARRWAAYADDAANRGEPEKLHGRRGVWSHQVGDLTEARVLGAAEDLATLWAALDRLEPPDRRDTPGGPRSLAQRRYDALVSLASVGLRNNSTGRIDPDHTINIVIDDATLAGEFDPNGCSDIPGWASVLPSAVQRLLCNSWISRVIMGPQGEVLELGRRARLFSPAQKRAIVIRDGGCALACCDRPPEWVDVHHLDPYGPPSNGETNLDNGLAMCRPHHTLVHQGWKPVQDPDGTWRLEPP